MSRIRSIKPEWLEDELLATASSDARVLSIALILLADDYGNGRAAPVILSGQVFPGKDIETLAKAREELANIRFITLYSVGGQSYFSIRNWEKHQRVDKPGKPKVPPPPREESPEDSRDSRESSRDPRASRASGPIESSPVESSPVRTETSGGHVQTVLDAFRAEYAKHNAGVMPKLTRDQRMNAVEHCRDVAEAHGVDLDEAATRVCRDAKPGSKDWWASVARVDPYAPPATAERPSRNGRVPQARSTTGADFENEPDEYEQAARLGMELKFDE